MSLKKDRSGALDIFLTALIILAILMAFVIYQAVMLGMSATTGPSPDVVERTDTIEFDYIGSFEDGRVFGTTLKGAAEDNVSYPKSLSFTYPSDGHFEPVLTTIGGGFIEPGAAAFFGMVNNGKALESRLLGMRVEESRLIVLEPEQAYGSPDPTKSEIRPLVTSVPQYEEMTTTAYTQRFDSPPFEGKIGKDPFWGWNTIVHYLNRTNDLVILRHNPTQGMIVTPYESWDTIVEAIDSGANGGEGEIRIRHLLTPDDANRVMGKSADERFIVTSVNTDDETFVADFNDERAGKVLYLRITLLTISKI